MMKVRLSIRHSETEREFNTIDQEIREQTQSLQQAEVLFSIYAASQDNLSLGFSTRPDTNKAVQPQKMARGLKLLI